jgi:hypothetical protein
MHTDLSFNGRTAMMQPQRHDSIRKIRDVDDLVSISLLRRWNDMTRTRLAQPCTELTDSETSSRFDEFHALFRCQVATCEKFSVNWVWRSYTCNVKLVNA